MPASSRHLEDLVVKVKCYHSGKFEKKEAIVDYVDGEVTMFELEAQVQDQLQDQEEANDQAQEVAEMEADFMAQLVEDQSQFEVQDISSTAPQPTQVLRRSNRLASLLFG
ncbi:hypothetical protein YC2023_053266 [Brassica napus]